MISKYWTLQLPYHKTCVCCSRHLPRRYVLVEPQGTMELDDISSRVSNIPLIWSQWPMLQKTYHVAHVFNYGHIPGHNWLVESFCFIKLVQSNVWAIRCGFAVGYSKTAMLYYCTYHVRHIWCLSCTPSGDVLVKGCSSMELLNQKKGEEYTKSMHSHESKRLWWAVTM